MRCRHMRRNRKTISYDIMNDLSAQPSGPIIFDAKGDGRHLEDNGKHFAPNISATVTVSGLRLFRVRLCTFADSGNLKRESVPVPRWHHDGCCGREHNSRCLYMCTKSFGDIYSSCAKHVNGRGKCKERGPIVVPIL